jgi:hypothetical protein
MGLMGKNPDRGTGGGIDLPSNADSPDEFTWADVIECYRDGSGTLRRYMADGSRSVICLSRVQMERYERMGRPG